MWLWPTLAVCHSAARSLKSFNTTVIVTALRLSSCKQGGVGAYVGAFSFYIALQRVRLAARCRVHESPSLG